MLEKLRTHCCRGWYRAAPTSKEKRGCSFSQQLVADPVLAQAEEGAMATSHGGGHSSMKPAWRKLVWSLMRILQLLASSMHEQSMSQVDLSGYLSSNLNSHYFLAFKTKILPEFSTTAMLTRELKRGDRKQHPFIRLQVRKCEPQNWSVIGPLFILGSSAGKSRIPVSAIHERSLPSFWKPAMLYLSLTMAPLLNSFLLSSLCGFVDLWELICVIYLF